MTDETKPEEKDHIGVKETAACLGVHWQTIYRWIRLGTCPVEKTPSGRYRIPMGWVKAQEWSK